MNYDLVLSVLTLQSHGTFDSINTIPPQQVQQRFDVTSLKKDIPLEIQEIVINHVTPQWLYLQQTIKCNTCAKSVCFDPSGKLLATVSIDGIANIFDLKQCKFTYQFKEDGFINSICFDPSGKLFAIATNKNTFIHNFQKCIWKKNISANSVCFSPSGKDLVIASDDKKIRIFDIQQNNADVKHLKFKNPINSVCFNLSGKSLAIVSDNKRVILLGLQNDTEFSCCHDSSVKLACFDPSEKYIATTSIDGKASLFNLETDKKIIESRTNIFVNSVCFSPFGTLFAMATNDGRIAICDAQQEITETTFHYDSPINSVSFDSSGKLLAVASNDENVYIFGLHDTYNIDQILLKKAFLTWLLIEKPNQDIHTLEKLLMDVALKCDISHNELLATWKTFPEKMRAAIWRTMQHRIKKYGKSLNFLLEIFGL